MPHAVPTVLVNPATDAAFLQQVRAVLIAGAKTPREMAERLRADYPRILVRARDLSGEADAWYVYRDGRWVEEPFRTISASSLSRGTDVAVPPAPEAIIRTDGSGRYLDANPAALALLGVSLDDLLSSSPDRFAFDPQAVDAEQEALRQQWDGTTPLVGHGGLRRADGTPIRVAFAFEPAPAGFTLRLSLLDEPADAPPMLLVVGDILQEWQAAQQRLETLHPGTADWDRVQAEARDLRQRYQSLFAVVNPDA